MLQTPLAKIHISTQTTKGKHRKIHKLVKFYVSSTKFRKQFTLRHLYVKVRLAKSDSLKKIEDYTNILFLKSKRIVYAG